jgi:hypothetical protein
MDVLASIPPKVGREQRVLERVLPTFNSQTKPMLMLSGSEWETESQTLPRHNQNKNFILFMYFKKINYYCAIEYLIYKKINMYF